MFDIRPARLEDTEAISALFRSRIARWQRIDASGQVQDVPYEALDLYERWLHGGPWMSLETGVLWLNHLIRRDCLPLVISSAEGIVGYTEAFPDSEVAPVGRHLYVGDLILPDARDATDALFETLLKAAKPYGRLSASCSAFDETMNGLFTRYGFAQRMTMRRVSMPAQSGQGFYRATDHDDADPALIAGWAMPLGRMTSPRHQWETLWAALWDAIPQIAARPTQRIHMHASGQEAYLFMQQDLYAARTAEIACWTPKAFSPQLLVAIRDRAYGEGYRSLKMTVSDLLIPMLGGGVETSPDKQHIFVREL